MDLGEVILVYVRVGVFLPVVAVAVLMFHMLMAVAGVRMGVGFAAVLVFVCMRAIVGVLLGHGISFLIS